MKYIETVNDQIKNIVSKEDNLVLFGQNISAGSCIGGLTRGMNVKTTSKVINSTNSENTLCGFGFGLMLNEVSSVFFMKQLDFLLLGIDQLVNTFNNIRNTNSDLKSSFTIMPVIVDNGFQGPQSSLNNFADFCSIARIPGYAISTKYETEKIIGTKLVSKGFRILGISQRLVNTEIIDINPIKENSDFSVVKYTDGCDVTIVCFNFSFEKGIVIQKELEKNGISSSIFNVTSMTPCNWKHIIDNVKITNKIIVIDDSKSENLLCYNLISEIHDKCHLKKKIILTKEILSNWLCPIPDEMKVDVKEIVNILKEK
ncbi:transketolase C-terminal domain-containing protein [Nitrosopumilus piranensis]|uniref:Putative pyruvate dehydrogenase E1 component, subunit beta n=1 Tax=Nitrosopumilus piranensis TaxID=1582439 RepID=A0A0C5BT12_9ARCH|nr:transketolase C-terminal domain-containing protein [Nitrosopumilus piranensis]AJM91279.1 putative pyruvate dehydrogenase E1 component, subunit beta [Nitrosopumilus piranensis]